MMPKIGRKKEDIVFVSGIGCSSRFPYYMNTYGMHTIHGRACAIASGLKTQNPNLSTWVITGDGDGLSIGGNHTIHAIRRNVNLNLILFNNEIYGLTKGQYSPTSKVGTVTKSSPYGSVDAPFNPASLALGAGATFFARTLDTDVKHMQETFLRAHEHNGCSFVEVLQNCVIFNDKVHASVTDRATREDNVLILKDGEPMVFGKEGSKGIVLDGITPKVVTIGEDGVSKEDILVHKEDVENATLAQFLSQMHLPEFPVPIGVFRKVSGHVAYDEAVTEQVEAVKKKKGEMSVQQVIEQANLWEVK
jgi:2-oxoglutarate ferredoxin oxidoreductase subunit beta